MATRHAARTAAAAADLFADVRSVADAILYEGYLLYPYRQSSPKNRVRWQFGVLTPRSWIDEQCVPDPGVAGAAESWFQQVHFLAEVPAGAHLSLRLRCLHLQRKECFAIGANGHCEPVAELSDGTTSHMSFDEAQEFEAEVELPFADLLAGQQELPVTLPGERRTEAVTSPAGTPIGHIVRTSSPVQARLLLSLEPAEAPFPLLRIAVRVENCVDDAAAGQSRAHILRRSLIATHLLVGLDAGKFLSHLDPPAWAATAVSGCVNRHIFPVLAGADNGDDVMLASPIILYDHPKVAPESPGDLHDAVEIDEILSLRTLAMTDGEKAEARATDPRAAEIVDRVETMPPEMMAKLHGAIRDLCPLEQQVVVAGQSVGPGSMVRLRPRAHGTDAYDMFLTGRTARVHDILHDVDGSVRLAVTIDDDPAAELNEWYGRFFHFMPEEVEPL